MQMMIDGDPVYAVGDDGQMDFYFWLGRDGVLESMNGKADFDERVEQAHAENEAFLNVPAPDESDETQEG